MTGGIVILIILKIGRNSFKCRLRLRVFPISMANCILVGYFVYKIYASEGMRVIMAKILALAFNKMLLKLT